MLVIKGEEILAGTFWCESMNPGIDFDSVGVQNESQAYLWRACKKHLMFQSFKSIVDNFKKNHGTSFNCHCCQFYNDILPPESINLPSSFEQHVFSILDSQFGSRNWIYGSRVLLGNFSSADVWFPKLKLFVMIDGQQHFEDSHGQSIAHQEETDDDFNYEALDRGFCVLRLHYKDVAVGYGQTIKLLQSVVSVCEAGLVKKLKPFLEFSPSFERARESL